jgi:TPR repeat protein
VASQTALGRYFLTGLGGTKARPQKALYRLRQAASAGDPDAQALLGATYLYGYGDGAILVNLTKAQTWLQAASDQGVAQAHYDLARYYAGLQDYEQTLERLEKAVAQDHPQAHTFLSAIYENGFGVAVDDAESVRLLRRAAVLGDPVAQTYLGVALREGSRMKPNARESFEWFEKAAAQGYVDGLVNLGIAYVKGIGVSRDVVRGVAWLEIGKARHSRNAIRVLSSARAGLTSEQLDAARQLQEELAAGVPEYVE